MERPAVRQTRWPGHRYFIGLVVVNVVFGRLAARTFPGGFFAFTYPLSDLGATVTREGYTNPVAPWIFSAGMLISAGVMFALSSRVRAEAAGYGQHPEPLATLCTVAAVGFLLMPAPHDLPGYHTVHVIGSSLVVFSLWAISQMHVAAIWRAGGLARAWLVAIALHGCVVGYAVFFVLDLPAKQLAQGLAVIALSVTLVDGAFWLYRHGYGIDAVIRTRTRLAAGRCETATPQTHTATRHHPGAVRYDPGRGR